MNRKIIILIVAGLISIGIKPVNAQVEVKKKVEEKTETRANQKVDKTIDKGLDKLEEGIGNLFGKKKKKNKNQEAEETQAQTSQIQAGETNENQIKEEVPELNWAKYDFIPGEKIIFEDGLEDEENGEFPSRWDLKEGQIEIAEFGGENVIMFREYGSSIVPYLKSPEKDYLPEIFTIELDAFIPHDHITLYFRDLKNQSPLSPNEYINTGGKYMKLNPAIGNLPNNENLESQWIHIAIAYTKGKIKAYINETRLINIPHLSFNPTGISITALHSSDKTPFYIKNIRIAEGGVKYYDRFLQDGKIIANGIRFDVNRATLKPESMGVLNGIAELMEENPEIKFSIEGHTDNDGDDVFNQTLSEQRAKTVLNTLTKMGISSDRLSSKGWGESKPIDTNSTAEGKANNRRVEFVKM